MGGGTRRVAGEAPGISVPGYGGGMVQIGGKHGSHNQDEPDQFRAAFGDMLTQNADSGIMRVDPLAGLVGQAPKRHKGGFGDVLSTILAVAADAADPQGRGLHTKRVAGDWEKRGESYDKALATFRDRSQMAALPGMTEREMAAYVADPKAWGSNMSRAATSRYDSATLNPGDVRMFGEGGGSFQAPTRGEQYAQALGIVKGSPEYDTAIRDQEMGAQGPTAFQNTLQADDHRTGNQRMLEAARQLGRMKLEGVRQGNRVGIEGVRQGNRMGLRGAPTYRDVNGAPPRSGGVAAAPRMVTATNPATGEKMQLVNGKWQAVR